MIAFEQAAAIRLMSDVSYQLASSTAQLEQILALQQVNLEGAPDQVALPSDGFVTVHHDLAVISDMNDAAGHVIAMAGAAVVAYALVMPCEFQQRIPILKPMFERLITLEHRQRPLAQYRYFVMGQVCVAQAYRGRGVFVGLYHAMRQHYAADYDFVVTEVATRNQRSVAAHAKVGFELLQRYRDDSGEEWDLIVWEWQDGAALHSPA